MSANFQNIKNDLVSSVLDLYLTTSSCHKSAEVTGKQDLGGGYCYLKLQIDLYKSVNGPSELFWAFIGALTSIPVMNTVF